MIRWGLQKQATDTGAIYLVALLLETAAEPVATCIVVQNTGLLKRLAAQPSLSNIEMQRLTWLRAILPEQDAYDIIAAWSFSPPKNFIELLGQNPKEWSRGENNGPLSTAAVVSLFTLVDDDLACIKIESDGAFVTIILLVGLVIGMDKNTPELKLPPLTKLVVPEHLVKPISRGVVFNSDKTDADALKYHTVDIESGTVSHVSGLVVKFRKTEGTCWADCTTVKLPVGMSEQETNRLIREAADAYSRAQSLKN